MGGGGAQELTLDDAQGFLQFDGADLRPNFLASLLAAVGDSGPIFVHNAAAERSVLRYLAHKDDCRHLAPQVEALLPRLVDTYRIALGR
jgi:hypothetical protein